MRAPLLTLALLLLGPPLAAQTNSGDPALSDVVVLHDGARVRGMILEVRSDGTVVFRDYAGEVREFDAAEVAFAGSVSDLPGGRSDAAPSAEQPVGAMVRFESNLPSVTVLRRAGTSLAVATAWTPGFAPTTATARAVAYEELCEAPCAVRIDHGDFQLAATYRRRAPVDASGARIRLDRDLLVEIDYTDRRWFRTGFGVGATVGVIVGTALMMQGLGYSSSEACLDGRADPAGCDRADRRASIGGGVALGSSLGYLGLLARDRVRYTARQLPRPDEALVVPGGSLSSAEAGR